MNAEEALAAIDGVDKTKEKEKGASLEEQTHQAKGSPTDAAT